MTAPMAASAGRGHAADRMKAMPTLVLLPGLDGTGDFFQPLLESLASRVRTRVVRYPIDGGFDYATCLELARGPAYRWPVRPVG